MAVRSMTGFGRNTVAFDDGSVTVELRAVNHRFAEFSVRMPRDLLALEESVRQELASHIARGRVDVYVSSDGAAFRAKRVVVDWKLLDALIGVESEVKARYVEHSESQVPLSTWLQQPDVLCVESGGVDVARVQGALSSALQAAVGDLVEMRTREGERLATALQAKLTQLDSVVSDISLRAPNVVQAFRARLRKRLVESEVVVDDSRLAGEVAIMADKAAIDEELTRLRAHLQAFADALSQGSPVGRRLDFLVQEFQREFNTIASKSSDLEISQTVVEGKTIVEQLREQVQNIE